MRRTETGHTTHKGIRLVNMDKECVISDAREQLCTTGNALDTVVCEVTLVCKRSDATTTEGGDTGNGTTVLS